MLGDHGAGRVEADDAPANHKPNRLRPRKHARLDVAHGSEHHSFPGPIKTSQGHHHSSRRAASAAGAPEDLRQRQIEMAFHILPRGLGGAVSELAVAQAVNQAHQRALGPLLDHKRIPVHIGVEPGPGRRAKGQRAGPDAGHVFTQPFAAHDARAAPALGGDFQFIHQPVHRPQARAPAARRREAVGQGLLDIPDAGALVLRFDLKAGPSLGGQRGQDQLAASRVADQVGGNLRHRQRNLLAGGRPESQAFGQRPGCAPGRPDAVWMEDFNGLWRRGMLLLQPFADLHGRAFADFGLNAHLIHQPFGAGQPHAQSLAGAEALLHRLGDIGNPRPVVLEDQFQTHATVHVPGAASAWRRPWRIGRCCASVPRRR